MNDEAYRHAAAHELRLFDRRAMMIESFSLYYLLVVGVCFFLPFWFFIATRVDVHCTAASQICQVDVQRAFGAGGKLLRIDMNGASEVRRTFATKMTSYLEVVGPSGIRRYEYVNGCGDLVDSVRQFQAAPTVDLEVTRSFFWPGLGAFSLGIFLIGGLLFLLVTPLRIQARSDDVQMIVQTRSWPFKTRTFVVACAGLVGAESHRYTIHPLPGRGIAKATIRLVTRSSRVDLFPRGIPAFPAVDVLAESLDAFVGSVARDQHDPRGT